MRSKAKMHYCAQCRCRICLACAIGGLRVRLPQWGLLSLVVDVVQTKLWVYANGELVGTAAVDDGFALDPEPGKPFPQVALFGDPSDASHAPGVDLRFVHVIIQPKVVYSSLLHTVTKSSTQKSSTHSRKVFHAKCSTQSLPSMPH